MSRCRINTVSYLNPKKLNSHSQVEIGIVIPGLHRPGIAAGLSGEESPSL